MSHAKFLCGFGSLLLVIQSGCVMGRPELSGTHLPPPPLATSRLQAPTPAEDINLRIRENLHVGDLPHDQGSQQIFIDRVDYSYWPDIFSVSIDPADIINLKIPYHYSWSHYSPNFDWHTWPLPGHFDESWELVENGSGSTDVGLNTEFGFTPDWNMYFKTKAVYPSGELAKYLVGSKLDQLATATDAKLNVYSHTRTDFEKMWAVANAPIKLQNFGTLSIQPEDVWLTPIKIQDTAISTSFGMKATPHIDGPNVTPIVPQRPPDTQIPGALAESIAVPFDAESSSTSAEGKLLQLLNGKSLPGQLHGAQIDAVKVWIIGTTSLIGLHFRRSDEGWLFLRGELDSAANRETMLTVPKQNVWFSPLSGSSSAQHQTFDAIAVGPSTPKPLPALIVQNNGKDDFAIAMAARLPFEEAKIVLRQNLGKTTLRCLLGTVAIDDVDVYGINRQIVIGLHVSTWFYKGWVYLSGDLGYRPVNNSFDATNLKIQVNTYNPLLDIVALLFKGSFEQQLGAMAYWPMYAQTEAAKSQIETEFNKRMNGLLKIRMSVIQPVVGADKRQFLFTDPSAFNMAVEANGVFIPPAPKH